MGRGAGAGAGGRAGREGGCGRRLVGLFAGEARFVFTVATPAILFAVEVPAALLGRRGGGGGGTLR